MKTDNIILIFDFDGVIVDSVSSLYEVYIDFLEEFGITGNQEEFNSLNGPKLSEIISFLKNKYHLQKDEKELLEIILHYPPFNFYDLIGDLIGLTNEVKLGILNEGATIKDISVDLEKKLEREEKEDKYIEFSTLTRTMKKIQEDFEFKSYQELKMQAMPVRMIKKKIIEYDLNRFPISIPGLRAFKNANNLKKTLLYIRMNRKIQTEKMKKRTIFNFPLFHFFIVFGAKLMLCSYVILIINNSKISI